MRVRIISVLVGVLIGLTGGVIYFTSEIKRVYKVNENSGMSFNYAVKKTISSVVYIFSDDCKEGIYGCPLGAGVIMDKAGNIATNYHVTKNSATVQVMLSTSKFKKAVLIGYDELTDISILKINDNELQPIVINPERKPHIGDFVFAIGNPYNLVASVSHGVISAIDRSGVGIVGRQTFIQTDVPINRGNSGGPLINANGEMIGLNSLIFNMTRNSDKVAGISFSLPVELVKTIMDKILLDGRVIRGCIGVEARNSPYLDRNGKVINKVRVTEIIKNSQAERVGILSGDVITRISTKSIDNAQEALDTLEQIKPGNIIDITLERFGYIKDFRVEVEDCNTALGFVE